MTLSIPYTQQKVHLRLLDLGIAILWLFHLSAIIGISLGNKEWFVSKTPLNLCMVLLLSIYFFPIRKTKQFLAFGIIFTAGMLVEWVGVQYGMPFGNYEYGANLGLKLDGVPLLIGCNWALMVFASATIAQSISKHRLIQIFIGASLMLAQDSLMEVVAPSFDYWTFETAAPWQNYVSWFVIAAGMQWVFLKLKPNSNRLFATHLALSQFIFFAYFSFV